MNSAEVRSDLSLPVTKEGESFKVGNNPGRSLSFFPRQVPLFPDLARFFTIRKKFHRLLHLDVLDLQAHDPHIPFVPFLNPFLFFIVLTFRVIYS